MSTTLFHTTADPGLILSGGFRASMGSFGLASGEFAGVFLAKFPAGVSDGALGAHILAVTFPDDVDLAPFAVVEQGHPVWEWCVPSELVNERATYRLLSDAERDALEWVD